MLSALHCAHPSSTIDDRQESASDSGTNIDRTSAEDVTRAQAALARGRELVRSGQHGDALAHFETATRLFPDWSIAHLELAMCRMVLNDSPADIRHDLERALELAAGNPRVHYALGLYHESYGSQDDALKAYRSALELRPAYPDALYRLAMLEEGRGDEAAAMTAYEQVYALDPTNVGATLGVVRCAQKLNKLRRAETLLRGLVRLHPDNLAYQQQLVEVLKLRGATTKARQLERAIARQRTEQERELRPLKPSRR